MTIPHPVRKYGHLVKHRNLTDAQYLEWLHNLVADFEPPITDADCNSQHEFKQERRIWYLHLDDEVPVEPETGCEGHESLNGADLGRDVYCDGSCRR